MNTRLLRPASAAVALAGLLAAGRPAMCASPEGAGRTPQAFFDYVHIESNSGAASGGHAAVCFTDWCFHFQQSEAGTIQLHREARERLEHLYRVLGNRTLHVRRVPVSAAQAAHLQEAFASEHRTQTRQFEVLDALRAERLFLEALHTRAHGGTDAELSARVRLPGTAYFVADGRRPSSTHEEAEETSAVIAAVAQRIRDVHGPRCLQEREAELRAALSRLDYTPHEVAELRPGTWPRHPVGLQQRHREILTGLVAVDVLRSARALRHSGRFAPGHEEFVLDAAEVAALRSFAARLEDSLVVLFSSPRPDWGYAMLVGTARLAALADSIRSRRLVVLDASREDADLVPAGTVSQHADVLFAVRDERRQDVRAARAAFFSTDGASELHWSRMETAANLFLDVDGALRSGRSVRVHDGTPVPAKSARRSDWPLPQLGEGRLDTALREARAQEGGYAASLRALYPYDLLRRNCVTELLRTIDTALRDPSGNGGEQRRTAAAETLGEDDPLSFIPFLSARTVERSFAGVQSIEQPSYRRAVLERMEQREPSVLVRVRESNVLTSTIYAGNGDDPAFLFFTEESAPFRPLFGLANLGVALTASLAGTATFPFDGGSRLRAGLEGALFSVPELVFVNIRKGSFAFAPRSWVTSTAGGF